MNRPYVLARLLRRALAAGLAVALLACGPPPADAGRGEPAQTHAAIPVSQLPPEAQQTLQLIYRGGPFPFRRDGAVFANREQLLPQRPRGYYTEYTVRTPEARDRGARRIVAGRGAGGDPATSGEYYYTEDHYNTFRRIRE